MNKLIKEFSKLNDSNNEYIKKLKLENKILKLDSLKYKDYNYYIVIVEEDDHEGRSSENILGIYSSLALASEAKLYHYNNNDYSEIKFDDIIINKIEDIEYNLDKSYIYIIHMKNI